MHSGNSGNSLHTPELKRADTLLKQEHGGSGQNGISGKPVANHSRRTVGKNDSRYWQSRIFRPINDRGDVSPHYSMRLQFNGNRIALSLRTGNKEAAARSAAGIYTDFLRLGVE